MSTRGPVLQIEGARELRRQMRNAELDLADLKDLHRRIGEIIWRAAKPKTPTGSRPHPPARRRKLAQTLRYYPTRTSVRVIAGSKLVPYAKAIHWGRKVFPSIRSSYPHKPPAAFAGRPWISEAAQATEPQWIALYEREIDKILDQIKGLGKEPK